MSTLQTIKNAQLAFRKLGDSPKAGLLTTIIGEAEMVGKSNGNRESTEEEVTKVLRRFEVNIVDTMEILRKSENYIQVDVYKKELELIRVFLPAKLTDSQVMEDIKSVMSSNNLPAEQRSMGVVSKELKAKYGSQYEGQQVSTQFKQMLGQP